MPSKPRGPGLAPGLAWPVGHGSPGSVSSLRISRAVYKEWTMATKKPFATTMLILFRDLSPLKDEPNNVIVKTEVETGLADAVTTGKEKADAVR
jgi:hypothetical protein